MMSPNGTSVRNNERKTQINCSLNELSYLLYMMFIVKIHNKS